MEVDKILLINHLTIPLFLGRPLPTVFWYVDDERVEGNTQVEPGKDIVVNKLRYTM